MGTSDIDIDETCFHSQRHRLSHQKHGHPKDNHTTPTPTPTPTPTQTNKQYKQHKQTDKQQQAIIMADVSLVPCFC